MISATPANAFKRIASLFLAFLTLFTLNINALTVTASAAKTNSTGIVWQSAWDGSIRNRSSNFYIKGNYWTKKKVTIVGNFLPNIASAGDKKNTYKKAAQFMVEQARFNVTVKDSRGKQVASYNDLKCNSSFTLPKWSTQQYTITVNSRFNSYDRKDTVQWKAAYFGQYYLKY